MKQDWIPKKGDYVRASPRNERYHVKTFGKVVKIPAYNNFDWAEVGWYSELPGQQYPKAEWISDLMPLSEAEIIIELLKT